MTASTVEPLDDFLGAKPPSKRSIWLKRGIMALVIAAIGYGLYAWLGGSSSAPRYATEKLERGDLAVTVSATGNLAPTNEVEVGSEVSGLVERVFVEANDRVVKGQVLARLDVSKLTDTVNRSKASVDANLAAAEQARAALQFSRSTLARFQEVWRLSGGKVPALAEMDSAKADVAKSVAALKSAEAQVAQARAQLNSEQTTLSKGYIVSPVTGVVLSRDVEEGQTVAASFNTPKLFVIAEDLSAMKLEVKVDEADVGQVAAGQAASFSVDAFPGRKFPAYIQRVNLGSSASTSATSTSTVISYVAVLSVRNDEQMLRPGMTATADIITSEKKGVLMVPNAALRFTPPVERKKSVLAAGPPGSMFRNQNAKVGKAERGSEKTLYTLDAAGAPSPLVVIIGSTNGSFTEVSGKDLKPGMAIITSTLAAAK